MQKEISAAEGGERRPGAGVREQRARPRGNHVRVDDLLERCKPAFARRARRRRAVGISARRPWSMQFGGNQRRRRLDANTSSCDCARWSRAADIDRPRSSLNRYDTRCYFNVRSKADISQLNLPHGTDN